MAAREENDAGLRDGFLGGCLSSSGPSYRGDEFSQTIRDLCRINFASDDQIDSERWLTGSLVQPTPPLATAAPLPLPAGPTAAFTNTMHQPFANMELFRGCGGGGVGGRGHGESVGHGIGAGARGTVGEGASAIYVPQFGLPSGRDIDHGSYRVRYPGSFDQPRSSRCAAGLPAENSPLLKGFDISQSLPASDSSQDESLRRLRELQFPLDILPLADNNITTQAGNYNYLSLLDDPISFPSGSLVGEDMKKLRSNSNYQKITIPKMSSGCTITSTGNHMNNPSVAPYPKDGFIPETIVSEISGSDVAMIRHAVTNSSSIGARKVLKANRRLKDKNDMAGSTPACANPVQKPTYHHPEKKSDVVAYVTRCLTKFGLCIVDHYMGTEAGTSVLNEVQNLEMLGLFEDGQIISQSNDSKAIRGDKIMWVEHDDKKLRNITGLITKLDMLIEGLNGQIEPHRIKSRTKAMIACYPGHGRGYMRHIDNVSQDGRCITCLYYLNKNWNKEADGGMLRMFPSTMDSQTPIDVEPKFDRLLLFWSDHRNPHEVQPAYRDRYAITVWYFDEVERNQAKIRYMQQEMHGQHYGLQESSLSSMSLS